MNYLVGLSEFSVVVPVAVVLASAFIKKLLNVSFVTALVGIAAPLILPLRELPIAQEFQSMPRAYLVGGAWGSILCGGFLWTLLRPLVVSAIAGLGVVRMGYLALLGAALIVAGLLVANPEPLARNFPGWKGPAGTVLLAASCISVARSVWKMVRATAFVALWGGVALILASSIFLDKLPHHIRRGDLQKIHAFISEESVARILGQLEVLSSQGSSVLGFLRVSEKTRPGVSGVDRATSLDV